MRLDEFKYGYDRAMVVRWMLRHGVYSTCGAAVPDGPSPMERVTGFAGQTIPRDAHGEWTTVGLGLDGVKFVLFKSGEGPRSNGRGRKRFFVECPMCGKLIECGHFGQHFSPCRLRSWDRVDPTEGPEVVSPPWLEGREGCQS